MQIVRQSKYVSSPWKNGGGVTREVMCVPAQGAFRWRVSVAQIDSSGPFSDFAGYQRKMVLLRGSGVRLSGARHAAMVLREPGDLLEFDGAAALDCTLLDGPCTDLNLMVADACSARVWVQNLVQPVSFDGLRRQTVLIFAINGALLVSATDATRVELAAWDFATANPGESLTIQSAEPAAASLAFFAELAG
jgi:environmental stress-induced protein Ves